MKIRSRVKDIVGLLFLTILFGYAAVHVLVAQVKPPSLALSIGAYLIPGVFLILLVREVLAARSERQRGLKTETIREVPNPPPPDGIRRPADGSRKPSV
mgnify:CR=1 FL=1